MDCEQARQHLANRLTGSFDGERSADAIGVDDHLRACTACRQEAAAHERLWRALAEVSSPPPDSAAMRARFAAMLQGYTHGRDGNEPVRQRANGWLSAWWPRQPIARLAAAALLLVGVLAGRWSMPGPALPDDPADEVAALRQELRDMRQLVTLSLMQQQSASDRLRGVSWSARIEEPGDEVVRALLDTLAHDPNVNVRLASVDALARFAERQMVRRGAIDALSAATSPLVQIALIDFLTGVQERGAVDTLRRLSADQAVDAAVRSRAAQGIEQLGGRS